MLGGELGLGGGLGRRVYVACEVCEHPRLAVTVGLARAVQARREREMTCKIIGSKVIR